MTNVVPFSQALRDRTTVGDDTGQFMADLMCGRGTRDDYVAMVGQHWFVYEALERAAAVMVDDPVAKRFITPQLTRLPALEADLEFLVGRDWHDTLVPLDTTAEYVDRLRTVAATWAGGFVAHHYTRTLGDLSSGSVIRGLMQRQFGFETNGVGFYLYDQIAEPKRFKTTYRAELDLVDWDDAERDRVIDEVQQAYRLSTGVFRDLAAAKRAASAA